MKCLPNTAHQKRLPVALVLLSSASTVLADQLAQQREMFRQYASEHEGDSGTGKQLYEQHEKLLCKKCHNIRGKELSGPNLEGIPEMP